MQDAEIFGLKTLDNFGSDVDISNDGTRFVVGAIGLLPNRNANLSEVLVGKHHDNVSEESKLKEVDTTITNLERIREMDISFENLFPRIIVQTHRGGNGKRTHYGSTFGYR